MAEKYQNLPRLRKMAMMYERGQAVPKDATLAVSYYLGPADAGDQRAMLRLAAVYHDGELGQAPNPELEKSWRERADQLYATVNNLAGMRSAATGVAVALPLLEPLSLCTKRRTVFC